jgi:hypothetical protein
MINTRATILSYAKMKDDEEDIVNYATKDKEVEIE